jgi:type I restriction enzyme S subunit
MLVPDGKYLVYGANGVIGKYNKYNHENSEVLMTCRGATCGTINVSAPYSWINGNAMVVHPRTIDLNAQYLVYQLKAADKTSVITGAAQPQITRQMLQTLPFVVAPITDQQRIVSELDCLNEMIALKQEQLKEFDKLAQSIFYDMFGDPVTNDKEWKEGKMGEFCTITSSKRIFANEYCEEGVPFYRGKEITELSKGLPISVELNISQSRYDEIKRDYGIPSVGDILITAVGTIGNIWVVNDNSPFYFKDGNIVWVKDIKEFDPVFFRTILTIQISAYKHEMAQGCAYNALTIVNLKKMKVLLPSLALQQQFAEKIKAIEMQKELVKKSIAETQHLLDSRMDYYFD